MSSRQLRRRTIASRRGEGRALRFVPSEVPHAITEIQNLLSNSKVRNVIHSGRITFRVLTNYIPRLGELQSAVMANYNPRSQARPTPRPALPPETGRADRRGRPTHRP